MKKTKTQKGITLVALIITIIVLLILAVVAITAIKNDGIFGHANNAATKFNDAQGNEQNDLNTYEDLLNRYAGGSTTVTPGGGSTPDPDEPDGGDDSQLPTVWTQTGTTVQKGTTILTVGDYVDYESGVEGYAEEDGNEDWRVLGAEEGKILLTSKTLMYPEEYSFLWIGTDEDLKYALDEFSNSYYAQNDSRVSSGRAMTATDIDRVTGHSETNNHNYTVSEEFEENNQLAFDMLFSDNTNTYYTTSCDTTTWTHTEDDGYVEVGTTMTGYSPIKVLGNNISSGAYVSDGISGGNINVPFGYKVVLVLDSDVTMTRTSETAPWTIGTSTAE